MPVPGSESPSGSSNPPMPATLLERLGLLLGGVLLCLLPVAFVPYFHEEFAASKLAALVGCGIPAYLLLVFAHRRGTDPLASWRRTFAFFVPVLLAVSALKSDGPPVHLAPWLLLAVAPLVFLEIGAAYGATPAHRGRLLLLLALGAAPVLAIGLVRRHLGVPEELPDRPDVGLAATIGNSNELAEYAAPLGVFLFAASLFLPAPWRVFRICLAVPPFALVALSDSRAGILAVAAGILVAFGLMIFDRKGLPAARPVSVAVLATLVTVGVAFLLLPASRPVRDRLATIVDPGHATNQVRVQVWEATLDAWKSSPLTGVGAGRFEAALPPFRRAGEWTLSGASGTADTAHNEFLELLAEGGIPGLALGLVVAALVLRHTLRRLRDPDPAARLWARAAAGAFAAELVLMLVRSPLHHPCGVMVPALLLGTLSAGGPGRPFSRFTFWTPHVLLALAFLLGLRDLGESAQLARLRWSVVQVNEAVMDGKQAEVRAHLREAEDALARLMAPGPSGVPGPWNPARAYRAALDAGEIADLRAAIARAGLAQAAASFAVDEDTPRALLARSLELSPHHLLAHLHRARRTFREVDDLLTAGRGADAELRLVRLRESLEREVKRIPGAPDLRVTLAEAFMRERRNADARAALDAEMALWSRPPMHLRVALGQLALRTGTDPLSFGTFLDADRAAVDSADLESARKAEERADLDGAFEHLLAHLGDHPADHEALAGIARVGFRLATREKARKDIADKAVARSRLLMAMDSDRVGDENGCRMHVRISLDKDEELLDAWFLRARVAARSGDKTAAAAALQAIRRARVAGSDLRLRVERDTAFADLLRSGDLDAALSDA